jgi:hypothetical protein
MTYYLVRQGGEPVALVASIDLAREIVFSQPPAYYVVDKIQANPVDSRPRARAGSVRRAIPTGATGMVRG